MYFSDRERGSKPRTIEKIGEKAWHGIAALVESRIEDRSLGFGFPEICPDNDLPVGTDRQKFSRVLGAEIPEIDFPFDYSEIPDTLAILDLVEFAHRHVGGPVERDYHSYWRHYHLDFDEGAGKLKYYNDINRLFARQGLAYELSTTGQISRIATTPSEISLQIAEFNTGDAALDNLLTKAKQRYFAPGPDAAIEAVKELWDAWERLKTVIDPSNKKRSISSLISYAGKEPAFVEAIESEALTLTKIGNDFQIRHHEVGKSPLESVAQVRYLFQRLYALIELLISHLRGDTAGGQSV